jgi:collagen beta-1,O-galactosyltransferase
MERTVGQLSAALSRRQDRRRDLFPDPPLDVAFTTDWPGPLDGQRIDRAALQGFGLLPWKIASSVPSWSRPLKKGEIGTSISHWSCWKDAAARNEKYALVFEDDVVLVDSFLEQFLDALDRLDERFADWDLLYLGRVLQKFSIGLLSKDVPVEERMVRPGFSYCAHAYVLSKPGLHKVLSVGFEQALIPVDELLPALYTIHPRPDVVRKYRPLLNAYALEPSIALHVPDSTSDTEASDFID